MRAAIYARVSTSGQAQAQTIDQQVSRLQSHTAEKGWELPGDHVFRDDGYSGARLSRPGLDRLRDRASMSEFDVVIITEPDRLARKYVHQVLLIEELQGNGCRVEFLDRPMSQDPHDQLLLQIRGAVAEYERTLIAERMRRGRQAKLRAGQLLPWARMPYGYLGDPERPRDAAGLRLDPFTSAIVREIFARYLEEGASLSRVAKWLTASAVPTATGKSCWNVCSVRFVLSNPTYTGTTYANRTFQVPARGRRSPLMPVAASGKSAVAFRPEDEWIPIPVPAIVTEDIFDRVQRKLAQNQRFAARNNRLHTYLLRALVSCGACRMSSHGEARGERLYYICAGRSDRLRKAEGTRCRAAYVPARALDALVWNDLCAVLTTPALIAEALGRALGGQWLPEELAQRQAGLERGRHQIRQQQARLMEAYLSAVIELAEFERKRKDLSQRDAGLEAQHRQLEAMARERIEIVTISEGIEAFAASVRVGLAQATFSQQRALVELLVDRVVVEGGEVEIRYVIPTSPDGPRVRFCRLRLDYRGLVQSAPAALGAGLPVAGQLRAGS